MFLGHSKSVEWIRVPDSIRRTALLSGLKQHEYIYARSVLDYNFEVLCLSTFISLYFIILPDYIEQESTALYSVFLLNDINYSNFTLVFPLYRRGSCPIKRHNSKTLGGKFSKCLTFAAGWDRSYCRYHTRCLLSCQCSCERRREMHKW